MTRKPVKRWSAKVTRESAALSLMPGIFTWDDPKKIARSLKRSAEMSRARKGSSRQIAMSMLTFYVNRAGANLTARQKRILGRAKRELRKLSTHV
ncbi:TPA: hypothetical protein DIV48_03195 [Candidatus Kaiserbacteria bacterium]|nr:MAG: hypothetical protein UY93_C0003G0093 [Parcubacteria group bacterium GW2011_GWA1_56_13]KKW46910.1 MAG: hypothetical protein UY97_C0002G0021 [Parcubacteria group bacterium GW2011_GWB1_57_6]HCR52619.1 hypothetical protein [Candidatus Kaiserbacteria bacterium]